MKKMFFMLLTMMFLGSLSSAMASSRGESLYRSKGCVNCHGPAGTTARGSMPRLAGMDARRLATQLQAYQNGSIRTPQARMMSSNPGVRSLDAREIREISEYLSRGR